MRLKRVLQEGGIMETIAVKAWRTMSKGWTQPPEAMGRPEDCWIPVIEA